MKQRIVIAMALAGEPDLIIADEPTTALDVTIQAQIIQILVDLVRERGLALMLITHDMGVVAQACDRVVVLYAGRVAESNTVDADLRRPTPSLHPGPDRLHPAHGQAAGHASRAFPARCPASAVMPPAAGYHPRCAQVQADLPGRGTCPAGACPVSAWPATSRSWRAPMAETSQRAPDLLQPAA